MKCLTANGFEIIDRRDDPEYWKKDIDFTTIKDGIEKQIEVKWDSKINRSGALFFELLTDIFEKEIVVFFNGIIVRRIGKDHGDDRADKANDCVAANRAQNAA